jgi:hypothetical protein
MDDDNYWVPDFDPYDALKQLAQNQANITTYQAKMGKDIALLFDRIINTDTNMVMLNENQDRLVNNQAALTVDYRQQRNNVNLIMEEMKKLKLEVAKLKQQVLELQNN